MPFLKASIKVAQTQTKVFVCSGALYLTSTIELQMALSSAELLTQINPNPVGLVSAWKIPFAGNSPLRPRPPLCTNTN